MDPLPGVKNHRTVFSGTVPPEQNTFISPSLLPANSIKTEPNSGIAIWNPNGYPSIRGSAPPGNSRKIGTDQSLIQTSDLKQGLSTQNLLTEKALLQAASTPSGQLPVDSNGHPI